jgi:hypothetical protein
LSRSRVVSCRERTDGHMTKRIVALLNFASVPKRQMVHAGTTINFSGVWIEFGTGALEMWGICCRRYLEGAWRVQRGLCFGKSLVHWQVHCSLTYTKQRNVVYTVCCTEQALASDWYRLARWVEFPVFYSTRICIASSLLNHLVGHFSYFYAVTPFYLNSVLILFQPIFSKLCLPLKFPDWRQDPNCAVNFEKEFANSYLLFIDGTVTRLRDRRPTDRGLIFGRARGCSALRIKQIGSGEDPVLHSGCTNVSFPRW